MTDKEKELLEKITQGVSNIIPVDVYIPGCPPTAEAVIAGFQLMKERILKGA